MWLPLSWSNMTINYLVQTSQQISIGAKKILMNLLKEIRGFTYRPNKS